MQKFCKYPVQQTLATPMIALLASLFGRAVDGRDEVVTEPCLFSRRLQTDQLLLGSLHVWTLSIAVLGCDSLHACVKGAEICTKVPSEFILFHGTYAYLCLVSCCWCCGVAVLQRGGYRRNPGVFVVEPAKPSPPPCPVFKVIFLMCAVHPVPTPDSTEAYKLLTTVSDKRCHCVK